MTTTRILLMLVAASALATAGGLGAWRYETADAATPLATPGEGGCASDGRGFRDLLETVRAKAAALDEREAALRTREAGLAAVRKAATAEIARLEGVAKTLGITGAPGAGVSIAKVYESMPPEAAAPILDRLDDATLRAVLGRMHEKPMGAILAEMSHDRAVAVTKAFAGVAAPARP